MLGLRKLTVCLSEEEEKSILELRKTDEYCRCSLSEIARKMLDLGIIAHAEQKKFGKEAEKIEADGSSEVRAS